VGDAHRSLPSPAAIFVRLLFPSLLLGDSVWLFFCFWLLKFDDELVFEETSEAQLNPEKAEVNVTTI